MHSVVNAERLFGTGELMKLIISVIGFGFAVLSTPALAQSHEEKYKTASVVCATSGGYPYAYFTEDQIPGDMEINEELVAGGAAYGMPLSDSAGLVIQWKEFLQKTYGSSWPDRHNAFCNIFARDLEARKYMQLLTNKKQWAPIYPSNPSGNHASWSDANYLYLGRRVKGPQRRNDGENSDFKYYYYCKTNTGIDVGNKAYFSDIFGSNQMDDSRYALAFGTRVGAFTGKLHGALCWRNTSYADAETAKDRAVADSKRLGDVPQETGWRYRITTPTSGPSARPAARRSSAKSTGRKPH